jgi:hypothetical protein
MRCLIAVLVFVSTLITARAETWQEFVRARAAAGFNDMEIRRDLLRPYTETVTNTVDRAAETKALEARLKEALVPSIVSNPQWNSANREEMIIQRFALRQRQATNDAGRVAFANAREKWVESQILVDEIRRRGGDPFGDKSGTDTEPVVSTITRPPRWDTLKPVGWQGEPPTLGRIRRVMAGGDGVAP